MNYKKKIVRDDYRELIEMSIIFLGGDKEKKLKIRPPGASNAVDGSRHLLFENMFVAVSFQNKHEGKTSIARCSLIYCNSLCEALA